MAQLIDITNKRFGKLIAIRLLKKRVDGRSYWLCKCDCGKTRKALGGGLRAGHIKSCGCLYTETRTIHGYSKGKRKRIGYNCWAGMIQRCYYPNSVSYHNYGGKGIKVCKRWRNSFLNFLNDMGNRPSFNHSIERLNRNKHYTPSNCKWATRIEQSRNTKNNVYIKYKNIKMTIAEWAECLNLEYSTFRYYLSKKRNMKWIYNKHILNGI